MDARSGPGLNDPFEEAIDDALNSLPADLRAAMSNVEIVVEDENVEDPEILGLFEIMGGEDDGDARGLQRAHDLPHVFAQFDIDSGGGLVEHDHRRLVH